VSALAPEFLEQAERRTKALNAAYSQAVRAQQGTHPFQRVWPPMIIGVIFVVEVLWIVFLVYLPIKFIKLYF
jgi:hypothetical protein